MAITTTAAVAAAAAVAACPADGGTGLLDCLADLCEAAEEREVHQQRQRSDGPEHTREAGAEKRPHTCRVKLSARDVRQLAAGSTYRHRPLVAPGCRHHLEHVGHCDDPAGQGDVVTGEPARIAEPVKTLMVLPDCRSPFAEPGRGAGRPSQHHVRGVDERSPTPQSRATPAC